jgi:hypothetical protein
MTNPQPVDVNALARYGANARPASAGLAHLRALIADWDAGAQADALRLAGDDPAEIERMVRAVLASRQRLDEGRS